MQPFGALCFALLLFSVVSRASKTGEKQEAFPALKKRIQQQQQQRQQQQQQQKQGNQDDDDDEEDDDDQEPVKQQSLHQQKQQEQQQPQREQDHEAAADSMEKATPATLPVVPPPASVGTNGFPELPTVSNMLHGASQELNSVSVQVKLLESRAAQTQKDNEVKLAKQKAVFEQKLQIQEEQNRAVIAANQQISREINDVKKANIGLLSHDLELAKNNNFMRKELQELLSKIGAAQSFVTSSLTKTDDTGAKELAVLNLKKPHHASRHRVLGLRERSSDDGIDNSDMEDDENAGDEAAESFLSLGSRVTHPLGTASDDEGDTQTDDSVDAAPGASDTTARTANPNDLVSVLSKEVTDLEKEGKESKNKLRAMFIAAFQTGAKRHAALIAQQRALNATKASHLDKKSKLTTAEQHLDGTRRELEKRVRGLGIFLQKLSHVALAPTGEVSRLLKELPGKVTPSPIPVKRT